MSGLFKNIEEPTQLQAQGRVRVSSLNLKPSADITRSPKQGKNPWNWSSVTHPKKAKATMTAAFSPKFQHVTAMKLGEVQVEHV